MQPEKVVRAGAGTFANLDLTPHSLQESLPHRERSRIGSVRIHAGAERQRVTLLMDER